MYATNYFEISILNTFNGITFNAPSKVHAGLFLSDPTETGTAGIEVSYVGYKRMPITFDVPKKDGKDMVIINIDEVEFPMAQADSGTVTHIGIFDSEAGGKMLMYGRLQAGDELVIRPNYSPTIRAGQARHRASGNFSEYFKTAIFNALRGINIKGFTPHIGLVTGDIENGGNEFVGRGYARLSLFFTAPTEQQSGIMLIENTQKANYAIAENDWGVWNQSVIFDSATSGNPIVIMPEVGSEIKTNDMVKINVGGIKVGAN